MGSTGADTGAPHPADTTWTIELPHVCSGGRLCWTQDLGSPIVTNLALLDQRLYAVASAGRVSRLDAHSGKIGWTFDVAAYSQTKPRLFSAPAVVGERAEVKGHFRIYFGAELQMPLNSAAMVYCLRD